MPNIGAYHPVIVHFAIALLILGVIFRWISLSGRAPFTGPAAATCLLLGAAAAASPLSAAHRATGRGCLGSATSRATRARSSRASCWAHTVQAAI